MGTKIFVNLPVADLGRSVDFFTKLGYSFDTQFTDDNAACLVITEDIYAMLLARRFFQTFTKRPVVEAGQATEAIIALSVDSRAEVDEKMAAAQAAGATAATDPIDAGPMYSRSFLDPDGHQWEFFSMDEAALKSAGG